jgi:hypothetical protein
MLLGCGIVKVNRVKVITIQPAWNALSIQWVVELHDTPVSKILSQVCNIAKNEWCCLQKEYYYILVLPFLFLAVLTVVLYAPQIQVLSGLSFGEKANLLLTFAIAFFAAIEGYSTFRRASMESMRHVIEDARNELEKAYGPLYTLLNNRGASSGEQKDFWLTFEERKKLDEIMATYPFMFPSEINDLWQEKIRNLGSLIDASDFKSGGRNVSLGVYLEFRNLINEEYENRVKHYRELLEK